MSTVTPYSFATPSPLLVNPPALPTALVQPSLPPVNPYPDTAPDTYTPSSPAPPAASPPSGLSLQKLGLIAGGVVGGSFLPNPLGLFKGKAAKDSGLVPNHQVKQYAVEQGPGGRSIDRISPEFHKEFTRFEVTHPEGASATETLQLLLDESKKFKLPGSALVGSYPVFVHPNSTLNAGEEGTRLQGLIDKGTKYSFEAPDRSLSDADVDALIKDQKMTFISKKHQGAFQDFAESTDPVKLAALEHAERIAKLYEATAGKEEGKGIAELAHQVMVNAQPNNFGVEALTALDKATYLGGYHVNLNEVQRDIKECAISLLEAAWKHGETFGHFLEMTHALK